MNLSSDIIGTDPKYPKITNQEWLKVDPALYDNYPSDNNPVRVVPELARMWDHQGCGLIPNAGVQQLGLRSADKKDREDKQARKSIVREAKKAIMAGQYGSGLAKHLRARFTPKQIEAAAEDLKKVSEEIGLLGNVYIDASAFETYEEAKQFLRQHSHRLARDLLFNTEQMNPNVVSLIASDFRKNVVSSIDYNKKLFDHYKNYLVASKRIPSDVVIDSKESLRTAFLYQAPKAEDPKPREVKRASKEEKAQLIQEHAEKRARENWEASDALLLKTVRPIVAFAQETLSKGKSKEALKEMLKKFAMADLQDASQALAITVSEGGLTPKHIDDLHEKQEISTVMAEELKKIGKQFPIKKAKYEDWKPASKPAGVYGYEYSLNGSNVSDEYDSFRLASVEALKKGYSLEKIKAKLVEKLSAEEADLVLSQAVSRMNSTAAGSVANAPKKSEKKALIEEPKPRQTLPDEKTTIAQTKEITDIFSGLNTDIEIDPAPNNQSLDIDMGSGGLGDI